jgi:CheY-like chemotaxis protein
MVKLVREIGDIAARTFDKNINVVVIADDSAMVMGDASQLHGALLNLVINARDAMPDGGQLTIKMEQADTVSKVEATTTSHVKITVADTGIGMSKETKIKIFDPFFTTKELGKGTGLGLASVYDTILSHKGVIKVESELGSGSRFIITLPLKRSSGTSTRIKIKKTYVRATAPHTVMVVDDEEQIRDLIKNMLESLGYTVVTYADPADALHFFRHDYERVALSLIDMMMPTMNGSVLFAAMKNIQHDVKVLIMSGHTFNESIQSAVSADVLGFVNKPFDMAAVSRMVAEAITNRTA